MDYLKEKNGKLIISRLYSLKSKARFGPPVLFYEEPTIEFPAKINDPKQFILDLKKEAVHGSAMRELSMKVYKGDGTHHCGGLIIRKSEGYECTYCWTAFQDAKTIAIDEFLYLYGGKYADVHEALMDTKTEKVIDCLKKHIIQGCEHKFLERDWTMCFLRAKEKVSLIEKTGLVFTEKEIETYKTE